MGVDFLWQKFCQNHFWHQNRLKINIKGCKWVKYQYNLFIFYPYCITKAIFNWLNLRLSQKSDSLDTFLNKLCSRWRIMNHIYLFYFRCNVYSLNDHYHYKRLHSAVKVSASARPYASGVHSGYRYRGRRLNQSPKPLSQSERIAVA